MSNFVDNENYLKETEGENVAESAEENVSTTSQVKPRELFAYWSVGGTAHKLKLMPSAITSLERVYRCNLISLMGDMDNLPTLTTMLQVTHAAMEKWQHNLKLKDVEQIYEKWISEGGSMLQFYVEVYMKIFSVSGFFSSSMAAELSETMDEAAQKM